MRSPNSWAIQARITLWSIGLMIGFITLGACRSQIEHQTTSSPTTAPTPLDASVSPIKVDISVTELIKELPFIEWDKQAALLRAWAGVPNNRHYRAAQHGDFENAFMTSDYGELAGAYGFTALIVDKTISSPNRMSLIVFIERPGRTADVYWIYRDLDLSKYRMSRSSGDMLVDEVHEDGSRSVCEIEWVKNEKRWTCKAE